MTTSFICERCGGTTAKNGQLSGDADLTRIGRHPGLTFKSSKLIALFCGECGHVDSFKVERPDRF